MKMLSGKLDTTFGKLFSAEAFSSEGVELKDGIVIRLLSDDDIIFLMKKYYHEDPLIDEFFNLNRRRHAMWKSEAEYKAFILDKSSGGTYLTNLENALKTTAVFLSKNIENWSINAKLANTIEEEIRELPKSGLDSSMENAQRKQKQTILKVVQCLNSYAQSIGYTGDFILIKASQFSSGFLKPDFSKIKILFPSKKQPILFGEKISSLAGIASTRDEYYYLYYERIKGREVKIDVNEICVRVYREFVE